jgi:hypothetical protein
MAIVYIHYVFFLSFQFNSRKTALYYLLLKVTNFSWLWISWVSFACRFLVFLSCCNFFSYSCSVATTRTTTITSKSVSKGKGTPETSYKLWSYEFQNFGKKNERTTPKLILLPTLGLGSTQTHTRFDYSTRSTPSDATPHTLASLVHAFCD